ncbi:Abscisic acid G-protein coupled receptor-domain-containing protein [Scheffersomyces coipomensis]|uniref:Abscisic acid G-protein coupled receptor-domain-containing protein n=1 Tax=Scheffersomyces coipomensis TaxID=1788519 RepID=UPI00315DAA90
MITHSFFLFIFSSGLFFWIYKYIFNHDMIQNYSNRLHLPKSKINEYIASGLNYKYKLKIHPLDIDKDDEEEEADNIDDKIHKSSQPEEGSLKEKLVGVIFSGTITLSVVLVVLMLCELVEYMDHDLRLSLFHFTIDCLIFLLTVVQPFLIISLFINQDLIPKFQKTNYISIGLTILLFLVWFLALHKCGDLSRSFTPYQSTQDTSRYYNKSILEKKINEISIAGITILAILSGVGSTSTPFKLFSIDHLLHRFFSGKQRFEKVVKEGVSESDINASIQSFNNTTRLLRNRKQDLNKYLVEHSGTVYNDNVNGDINVNDNNHMLKHDGKPRKLGNIVHKVQSFANISFSGKGEEEELKREINSLHSLRNNLYNETINIITKYIDNENLKLNTFENNLLNTAYKWFTYGLAVYCIYRIMNVLLIRLPSQLFMKNNLNQITSESSSIIDEDQTQKPIPQTPSKDALAVTLSRIVLFTFRNITISEAQLANQLSFVLSGGLFICSFSNVLLTFKSFTRFFPPSSSSSSITKSWLKHVIIAQLLGIYVIATALLIRTNLPSNLSTQISKILSLSGSSIKNVNDSLREIDFIDKWFDKVFGFTVVITMCSLIIRKYLDETNNDPYDLDEYDEENLLERQ